jgi:gamma-glutamyltranspeptidase/glutathione hydrolase
VDAAVGAALTLAVVEPYNSGLGAGGLALLWDSRNKKAYAFDFREKAPLAATAAMFLQPWIPPDASVAGPLAIAVPGEIHGLASLHRRGGKLPWRELFADAIRYAESGFLPDKGLLTQVENRKECLRRDYDTSQLYQAFWSSEKHPNDTQDPTPPPWIQPALTQTLKQLAAEGPESFYQGHLGTFLVRDLQGKGALLSEKDLAQYQTVERNPLLAKFPWGQLWGFPLPSSGGISLIRGLQTMEALGKIDKDKASLPDWQTWMVEVLRQVFQTRNTEMGDGDFLPSLPVKQWTSKNFAKQQAKNIFTKKTEETAPSPLKNKTEGHTTHLSVIDGQGNAVAMTLTQNLPFGSCVTSGATGLMMNDQMDDFSTRPGQPNAFGLVQSEANAIAPGKRPLSSMTPTLVTERGRVILVIGSPGGPKIISTLLQVLYRHFFLGEPWTQAMAATRFHFQGIPHEVDAEQDGDTWGNVQAVGFDPKSGGYFAYSDPRGQGQAVVVFSK